QTSYAVASSLSKLELKKILVDKMEENNSINRSDVQKNLYRALLKAYNSDKELLSSYGEVMTLKRGRDDQDKDEEPSARSNRRSKRQRSGKEESSKEATQKESKSTRSSKGMWYRILRKGQNKDKNGQSRARDWIEREKTKSKANPSSMNQPGPILLGQSKSNIKKPKFPLRYNEPKSKPF
ncbi:hypothetical protein Tco_0061161, partial [Tanacetum coccineum]